jgi:hypothetical protein
MHSAAMLVLAAATVSSSADKLRQIPREFWVRMGLAILVIIAVVIVLRKLANMNTAVLTVVVAMGLSFVGFTWIYDRNEPAWATPAVNWLSGFFPSKGKLANR